VVTVSGRLLYADLPTSRATRLSFEINEFHELALLRRKKPYCPGDCLFAEQLKRLFLWSWSVAHERSNRVNRNRALSSPFLVKQILRSSPRAMNKPADRICNRVSVHRGELEKRLAKEVVGVSLHEGR
jgi:hypothetical protein